MRSKLETREKRARLASRREPYYEPVTRGIALGYRKHVSGTGAWVARRWDALAGRYVEEPLGAADDAGGDALAVSLDYRSAKARALADPLKVKSQEQREAERRVQALTCNQAVTAYVEWLTREGRASARNAKAYGKCYCERMDWADRPLFSMKPSEFPKWRTKMLEHKPAADPEALRKRKSSVNRVITVLLAAFERAADEFEQDGLPVPGRPWHVGLKKFTGVTGKRTAWMDLEQQQRLLKHCDVELRDVVHLMLITGLRPSEAIALNVADYEPGIGALYIRRTKVGRADWQRLPAEGRELCDRLAADRDGAEPLLTTDKSRDGKRWHVKHVQRRFKDAVKAAGLPVEVTPYAARHSFASALMADGAHSLTVANTLGHTTSRMVEAHYLHFRDSVAAQAIEALPRLLVEPKGKRRKADVVPIGRARKSAR